MPDARYCDADFSDRPLRLAAQTAEDLAVISTLTQDAVGRAGEVSWRPSRRRLAFLLNRFRWEDRPRAEREGRPYERVRAALIFDGVLSVRARGVDPADRETPLSLLRIDHAPDEEGPGGRILLALSGGGEVAIEVECIEACLMDLTRPWEAPSGHAPDHPLDEAG
ncbi:MAG TPA: DUF2948 family protein [Paracoccaceae bacterium]|nr:DUF2948 family protein [Paracoccaceae bacterium]